MRENIAVTVDILVLHFEKKTKILLVQRKYPPFEGGWALPGGFVEGQETLLDAACRELVEETGVSGVELQPFQPFDTPNRDPRHRTITMVYWGMLSNKEKARAGSDAKRIDWFDLDLVPPLAFDHANIVAALQNHIREIYKNAMPLLYAGKSMQVKTLISLLENFNNTNLSLTQAKGAEHEVPRT